MADERDTSRVVRRAAAGVAGLLLLTPIFGGWLAYSALKRGVSASDRAEKEVASRHGDVETLLRDAIDDTQHARALLMDPALRAFGVVTTTGDDLAAARELATIAGDSVEVGLDLWLALEEVGPSLYAGGRLDFAAVTDLAERVATYSAQISALESRLAEAERGSLGVIEEAFERAQRRLASTHSALETVQRALTVLPELFGSDRDRRYLIAFLTPSEARGGGGLLGVFTVLTARDGALDLGPIHTNDDINDRLGRKNVKAPAWFNHLYGNLTALSDVRQANLSINFPATSHVMLEMYREALGKQLDGVIAMDPLTLGNLTRALGPLRTRGWDEAIRASNARRLLLRDIYIRFPLSAEGRQNAYLARLVDKVWTKIDGGGFPIGAMGAALADSAASQHLKVFVSEPRLQAVVRDIGIGGDPTVEGPNVQAFFHNNFAGNKVDYYVERTQKVDIELADDGSARVATEITMTNDVPTEPVSLINRPLNEKLPIGLARMTAHFLLPQGARDAKTEIDGRRTQFFRGTDSGLPARWTSVSIEAGAEATLRVEYEIPDASSGDGFEFTLWPQALPHPDRYEIAVWAPGGAAIEHHNFERLAEGRLTSSGALNSPRTFTVDF